MYQLLNTKLISKADRTFSFFIYHCLWIRAKLFIYLILKCLANTCHIFSSKRLKTYNKQKEKKKKNMKDTNDLDGHHTISNKCGEKQIQLKRSYWKLHKSFYSFSQIKQPKLCDYSSLSYIYIIYINAQCFYTSVLFFFRSL